ncbi:hypothetical protein NG798_25445 [Ancylothrix sp. C2]|nr:hypothetical protein [Ancylothrix sp. D3o]
MSIFYTINSGEPVTFYPECFDERPGLQYMSWGNPLFERLMGEIQKVLGSG